jgi:hypothetical protein
MKVRSLALAFVLGGLGVTSAVAQNTGYPSTGRYSAPTLLPLPQASGPWIQGRSASDVSAPSATTRDVSPAANYVPQATTVNMATPAVRSAVPTISNPPYPRLSYAAAQEVVPPGPPAPAPSAVPLPPQGDVVVGGMGPSPYEAAASNGCWGGDCGCDLAPCCTTWYGYVGGLVMGRDSSNKFWTTFETGNNPNQLLYFPDANWGGGFEATIGYTWCGETAGGCGGCADACGGCGMPYRHGVEVTYWGLWGLDSEASIRSETDSLSTPIDLGFVDIVAPGSPASLFFDNAREHRLRRENEFHNVEVNLVDFSMPMSARDLTFQWLVGARFFRFDEFLQFASVAGGNEFGNNAGLAEAYLDLDVENNLYGVQIGGRGDWRVHRNWRIFAGTKVGVFANDIDFDTQLYRGDGALAVFSSTGNTFNLSNNKVDVSMLAQIDLGVSYDITRNWSATIGYRAVGITGLALADDQIPAFLAAEGDWTDIDSNGSMILHGGFAGLEFRY